MRWVRQSLGARDVHAAVGAGHGKKGKGGEDAATKAAATKGVGAVPGLPDQQKIEDWTEQHISGGCPDSTCHLCQNMGGIGPWVLLKRRRTQRPAQAGQWDRAVHLREGSDKSLCGAAVAFAL